MQSGILFFPFYYFLCQCMTTITQNPKRDSEWRQHLVARINSLWPLELGLYGPRANKVLSATQREIVLRMQPNGRRTMQCWMKGNFIRMNISLTKCLTKELYALRYLHLESCFTAYTWSSDFELNWLFVFASTKWLIMFHF